MESGDFIWRKYSIENRLLLMLPISRPAVWLCCLAVVILVSSRDSIAAKPAVEPASATSPVIVPAADKLDLSSPAASASPLISNEHPLSSVLKYAREEQEYLNRTVHDFACRLVKRERIDGILQDYNYIDMQVRETQRSGNDVVKPFSIFLKFLGPADVVGRKVLYIEGRNQGKMLVRRGGKRFEYVVVEIDPLGDAAKTQSLVPITETGFNHVLSHMIRVLEMHAQTDASGENTKVQRIAGAKINHRPCNVIRVTHPKKQPGLEFHVANVFVDDALHVPVRVDYCDWPKNAGEAPPLIAEYTYTNLELNVNLTDRAFDPGLVHSGR